MCVLLQAASSILQGFQTHCQPYRLDETPHHILREETLHAVINLCKYFHFYFMEVLPRFPEMNTPLFPGDINMQITH